MSICLWQWFFFPVLYGKSKPQILTASKTDGVYVLYFGHGFRGYRRMGRMRYSFVVNVTRVQRVDLCETTTAFVDMCRRHTLFVIFILVTSNRHKFEKKNNLVVWEDPCYCTYLPNLPADVRENYEVNSIERFRFWNFWFLNEVMKLLILDCVCVFFLQNQTNSRVHFDGRTFFRESLHRWDILPW